jgi:Ssp1 endopeptidase immunity protein Rap1a
LERKEADMSKAIVGATCRAILVAGTLSCLVSGAAEAYFFDGNKLSDWCGSWKSSAAGYLSVKSAQCGAYITGVLDTLDDRGFCLPKEAVAAQTIDVVILYLRDHPERLHLPASGLVVDALKEKFPC